MNDFWKNTRVLVTGGNGFIGSFVVEKLVKRGALVTVADRMSSGSLRYLEPLAPKIRLIRGDCADAEFARKAAANQRVVINLAAHVGGISYNMTHQATMLRDNFGIASAMLEGARLSGVERFLVVSSACVYPRDAAVPTPETEGHRDEPEPTNSGYGWAKRMAEKLGMMYADQFGMKVGIVRPYNAYGPRDNFAVDTSHVIPGLIRRIMNGEDPLTVWGSGSQTRAFLYVEDLADGIITAIEKYPVPDPVNLGSDEEVTVGTLATLIAAAAGKEITVKFDTTKPDGSPRRSSDNAKAKEKIGFTATTGLSAGLSKTISWYVSQTGHLLY
ncbi:NAD-dependent epimerase/dehydratase family protein [Candidatus Gottesmanbacteria bacterium]|nr:NAD-dependent epimerase/dehydratase family protein [Candidatus Gottesmanbacteria bacterium]